jgi:peroxiredoxin Q/BCP
MQQHFTKKITTMRFYFKSVKRYFFAALLLMVTGCLQNKKMMMIDTRAPGFSLYDEQGVLHSLSALRGKKIALVFYPWDQSLRCTQQVCSVRDGFAALKQAGIVVLCINPGSQESHQKFKIKHRLPFPLLSDPTKAVAQAYGARRPLRLPNRRITVLIDERGMIIKTLHQINVNDHAQEIIEAFEQ